MRIACAILMIGLAATSTQAQVPSRAEVTVTAIAGADIFLDRGSDHGLSPGDTLTVFRAGQPIGHLLVRSVASSTASAGFVDRPFAITRGEVFTIEWRRAAAAPAGQEEEPAQIPDRGSILTTPSRVAVTGAQAVRLSGRVQVGSSGFWATGVEGAASRFSGTPFAGIRARLDGLPGGLRADVDGRASYRYRTGDPFERQEDIRVYRASVGGDAGPLEFEAGRLRDPYDRFTGFTDGLRIHLGDAGRGIGLAAGFEPEWGAGAFSTDLPRATATAHSRFDVGDATGEMVLLAGQVRPRLDGLVPRSFAGTRARLGTGVWHVSVDALLDRDPATGAAAFSRLIARGQVSVTPELRLDLHAARRRPYVLLGQLQTMRPPSDRLGAGVEYGSPLLAGARFRADATYSTAGGGGGVWTMSSGVLLPRLPIPGLVFSADGSFWMRERSSGAFASGGLGYSVGGTRVGTTYRFSASPQPTRTLVTHGADVTVVTTVARGAGWTFQAGADLSERIVFGRAYTGLWIRF